MSLRKLKRPLEGLAGTVLMLAFTSPAFAYDIPRWAVNLQPPASPVASQIYDLHMLIFWICVVIGVVVFGVMFYSIYYHRKSRGAKPAHFHENTSIEVVWTVIPFLILVGMAIPATQTLIEMEDASAADMSVLVTGYQWRWRYEYLDEDIGFFSNLATTQAQIRGDEPRDENYLLEVDEPLVIPTNKKVRFLLTSNDVIHQWWVPRLGVKKAAIPGFVNELWTRVDEPGVYRGLCAELCGRGHAYMPVVVVAKSEEDYADWVAERRADEEDDVDVAADEWSLDDLKDRGREVYAQNCAACHQAGGEGIPGTFPALTDNEKVVGDIEPLREIVMDGVPGTAMAAFGPQLNDRDLAAVITYIRNAWGNDAGDVIQPADIADAR